MALLDIIFGIGKKASIGAVTVDASVEELHEKSSEVTEHPVEVGVDTSDHIRSKPDHLRITGIITNHPIVFLGSLLAPSPVNTDNISVVDRAQRADEEFRRIMNAGELVNVSTTLREYKNMAITGYSVTRTSQKGASLHFVMEVRELVLVTTERVDVPVPVNAANGPTSELGKKVPKPADTPTAAKADESILLSIGKGLGAVAP